MTLRNVSREKTRARGYDSWRLKGPDGEYIEAFDRFAHSVSDEKFATRKRYCEVNSRFIDYLYEVGILGAGPVTRTQVNDAIDYYLLLLRDGENISLRSARSSNKSKEVIRREDALRQVAVRLGITRLAPNSWSNTIAPLNRFLRLCALLQEEIQEHAVLQAKISSKLVRHADFDSTPLIEAIEGSLLFSKAEVAHLKTSSALGSVIRFRGEELRRPRGLKTPNFGDTQNDRSALDFPMEHFERLLYFATSWRDRALWLLTAASGIRRSEALNVEWHHIDVEAQIVYVLDPDYRRYGRELDESDRLDRFKGRTVSWTYLRMPYRQQFFEALLEYRRHEYVLPEDGNDYVFQYVEPQRRGRPYREASDAALNDTFTGAVKRARIPGPPADAAHVWTQHSLRHAYGVYMLNDFQVVGQSLPGLTETEVQLLMGHEHISATRKYARHKESRLRQKLELHDQHLLGYEAQIELAELPELFAKRLRSIASNSEGIENGH
ncbi:tyrosine-type recombinase/integrase [Paraburkholderia xenovorans]|jgi:Phage integrase family